jgi:hypothetical protein
MGKSEAVILADTYQCVRDLTRWYFSLLKPVDPYKHWEVNGVRLNSLIWIASHITWAENMLLLQGTGGTGVDIAWLNHYNISSDGKLHNPQHDMKTVLDTLKHVHERAMQHIQSIPDEKLDAENTFGMGFGGVKTNRILIQHAIRHEAIHTGHLSWLCKINHLQSV